MGIHDIPADLDGFERLLDEYEAAHFRRNDSSRTIADATLSLMATFPAQRMLPTSWVYSGAQALIDPELIDALGYPPPNRHLVTGVHRALRVRGALVRRLPPRRRASTPAAARTSAVTGRAMTSRHWAPFPPARLSERSPTQRILYTSHQSAQGRGGQALLMRRLPVRAAPSSAGGAAVDPRTTSSVASST